MTDNATIEARFWKDLKASPFVMLGLDGARDGHVQPMTAQLGDNDASGPIWFFASRDNSLIASLGSHSRAIATYTAKGHDLFASIHGELRLDTDAATIDRLWNDKVAAWYEGGRNDPKIALLRLDTERAEIWLGETGLRAAVTRLFGKDPKAEAKDKVAEVAL